ncbi:YqgE/AlgH family protein [Cellvibrio sp. pealriver]|uniref:YqgE/AlgH family protein n=1 Tax=Cellvibrio sp. pealriver TaxID=1622269 RepID=UPI00066FE8DA|nr:YqgE/AlgH family protein [Cellvibrio sp. pealriver]
MNSKPITTDINELTPGSLRDHFLIAMPGLNDSSFAHTVTYVCEHSDKGAMGVVINAATPMLLKEIFLQMDLDDLSDQGDQIVMSGGPVQPERGFVLHTSDVKWQSTLEVSPDISLTASRDIIVALAEGRGPKQCLIALGYAGWGEGQLEAEIAANSWLTVPANKDIIFNTPLEQRWASAAQVLGIDVNLIASTPGHA